MLNQTRRESRDHATLSDLYTNNVILRLAQICEDVLRLFKKVSEAIILPSFFYYHLLISSQNGLVLSFYLLGLIVMPWCYYYVDGTVGTSSSSLNESSFPSFGFNLALAYKLMEAQNNVVHIQLVESV